jgi:hypothetical protein
MRRLFVLLLSFTVLVGCDANVRVEDDGGRSTDDGLFGGFGNGVSAGGTSNDGGFGDGSGGFSSGDGIFTTVGTGGAPPEPGPACYLDSGAYYLVPDVFTGVETGQGVCSAEQIDSIASVCLESQLTDECWAWGFGDNQACWHCVFFDGVGPELLPVVVTGNSPYLTHYACAAHVLGLPECAVPFQSFLFCGFTACEECDVDDGSWTECVDFALNSGICAQYAPPPACDSLFQLEEIPVECIGSATTIDEAFPILADYYCGAP